MNQNVKLSLFPHTAAVDSDGHLTLGGHRMVDLAAQFGTPLYAYDLATIRAKIAAYRQALKAYPGSTRLTYASKAFLCTALARFFGQVGIGFDIASAGELFIAQRGGANPVDMHLHGNNKTPFDLEQALKAGVGRIVVDNQVELDRLTQVANQHKQRPKIWLRVTPDVMVETHHRYTVTGTADSKFGFTPAEAQSVAETMLNKGSQSSLQLTGLHFHLGSYFNEAEPLARAVGCLLDIALYLHEKYSWRLAELCPGGGWGVPYQPDNPAMPIEPFVHQLTEAIASGCRARNLPRPSLILEPGRSLVAQAGVALYAAGARKVIPDVRTYVNIDGGLADNPRPALYQAKYTALLANRAAEASQETVAIAGPFCESGDVLIEAVDLPIAQAGDLLAVPVAGAYQLSMSSNYNAARRPAVIFVDAGEVKLVQRRETLEDLIKRDVL